MRRAMICLLTTAVLLTCASAPAHAFRGARREAQRPAPKQAAAQEQLDRQRVPEFSRRPGSEGGKGPLRRADVIRSWADRHRVGVPPRERVSIASRGPLAGVSIYARTHLSPQPLLSVLGGSQTRGGVLSSLRQRLIRKASSDGPVFGFRSWERTGSPFATEGRIFAFLARR